MDLHPKQFVRVNVRTIRDKDVERVVNRNFSVDPRTITLDRLQHLIARALDVRGEFSVLCMRSDGKGPAPLTCDWDLEGALSEEPHIELILQVKPQEPGLEEWDIICPADVPVAGHEASSNPPPRKGSFLEQVLQICIPPSMEGPHLTESEFALLADWPCPLRYAVYRAGGADAALRPALWMHLLDVYPPGAGHKERKEFLNHKAEEYYGLRHSWQKLVQAGIIPTVLRDITCLVRKDVRRTDRLEDLDEHSLYNVLTTYALHHPSIGYCQGMSDLLSPLMHVMKTEAHAYVALCGLMSRMCDNFRRDGRSISVKFRHLRHAIRTHDPLLYEHLARVGALDLIFCYRWLLLDLKREFPYIEMLRLMEVTWSTLRPCPRDKGVELYEVRFPTTDIQESLMRNKEIDPASLLDFAEDHFGSTSLSLKRWAMMCRRQSIAAQNVESDNSSSSTDDEDEGGGVFRNRRRKRMTTVDDNSNNSNEMQMDNWLENSEERRRHGSSDSNYGSNFSDEDVSPSGFEDDDDEAPASRGRSEGYESHQTLTDDSEDDDDNNRFTNSFGESAQLTDIDDSQRLILPPPTRFGDGKPFLIFMCLTMILNHRDTVLERNMDASEIGIYFDRLVRRHKLSEVMPRAKELFAEYLRTGWTEDEC